MIVVHSLIYVNSFKVALAPEMKTKKRKENICPDSFKQDVGDTVFDSLPCSALHHLRGPEDKDTPSQQEIMTPHKLVLGQSWRETKQSVTIFK